MRREGLSTAAAAFMLAGFFALLVAIFVRGLPEPPKPPEAVRVATCPCWLCQESDDPTLQWELDKTRAILREDFKEMKLKTDVSDMTDRELCEIWRSLFAEVKKERR